MPDPLHAADTAVRQLLRPIEYYQRWEYKNTGLLAASLVVFFILLKLPAVADFFAYVGSFGYLGAFVSGLLLSSAFTVAPATVVLFDVARTLDPFYVALVAGAGCALGDYLVLRIVSTTIFDELGSLAGVFGGSLFTAFLRSPYFQWVLPLIGAFIIAAPVLPDELGVSILGLSNLPRWRFFLITFLLNTIGILLVVVAASAR